MPGEGWLSISQLPPRADRWLLGDGALTGHALDDGAEARRIESLVGEPIPPDLRLRGTDRRDHDPVATDARSTVLFAYPATSTPGVPTDLTGAQIPGRAGRTLESRRFRAAWPRFQAAGIAVHGVSTQSPQEQAAFAHAENLPFPSLSDVQFQLASAPRLPTFRAGQNLRLKRLILVVGPDRTVQHTLFPISDIPAAVSHALALADADHRDISR
ncbi:redoxin domain-containing protein [Streptomyces sp. NPDC002928]|uniref:redoxin domain-containing protein n=1 Tax=Streptomyces sp. NPDC002928 TaxID=3154440 RepID=UPI0033BE5BCF